MLLLHHYTQHRVITLLFLLLLFFFLYAMLFIKMILYDFYDVYFCVLIFWEQGTRCMNLMMLVYWSRHELWIKLTGKASCCKLSWFKRLDILSLQYRWYCWIYKWITLFNIKVFFHFKKKSSCSLFFHQMKVSS